MSFSLFDIRTAQLQLAQLLNASGTSPVTIHQWTGTPYLITDIILTNSDTIAHVCDLKVFDGGAITRQIGSFTVAAREGYDGTAPFLLNSVIVPAVFAGWASTNLHRLQIALNVAMVGASTLDVVMVGGWL